MFFFFLVQEMVHCAVEYGSPCDADFVTFGEFCVSVDELQHHYEIGYVCDLYNYKSNQKML